MRINILCLALLLAILDVLQVFGQNCPQLKNPANGRVKIRARGRIAKFRCWRKYTLLGPKIIICSGNKWSLNPPLCVRKGCNEIEPTVNLTVTKKNDGAVLTFKCDPPLKLTGNKLLTCDGNKWSGDVPICEYVEPGNSCDFEDENICGWKHDIMVRFKWKWNSGTTPTRRTGPSYDHTLGKDGNGHYMFMESSSPIKQYDTARLLSPYFGPTSGGQCFQFWYHMYGQTGYRQVGNLKIYTQEIGSSSSATQKEEFSISGNQGDAWLRGQFEVGARQKSFRFIIEGQKQKSYLSDISIDDVSLYNCSDDYDITTETTDLDTTSDVVQETTKIIPRILTTASGSPVTNSHVTKETTAATTIKPTIEASTRISSMATTQTSENSTTAKTIATSISRSVTMHEYITTMATNTTQTADKTSGIIKVTTKKPLTTSKSTTRPSSTTKSSTVTTSPPKRSTTTTLPKTTTHPTSSTTRPTTTTTRPTTTTTLQTTTRKATTTTLPTTKATTTTLPTTTTTLPTTTTTISTTLPTTTTTTRSTTVTTKSRTTKPTTGVKTSPTAVRTTTTPVVATRKTTVKRGTTGLTKIVVTSSHGVLKEITTQNTVSKKTMYPLYNNATDLNFNITTEGSVTVKRRTTEKTPMKPLMIGVGVGVAIGLIIVFGAIYIYLKKRRKDDVFEDEMEPIAKNAVYD